MICLPMLRSPISFPQRFPSPLSATFHPFQTVFEVLYVPGWRSICLVPFNEQIQLTLIMMRPTGFHGNSQTTNLYTSVLRVILIYRSARISLSSTQRDPQSSMSTFDSLLCQNSRPPLQPYRCRRTFNCQIFIAFLKAENGHTKMVRSANQSDPSILAEFSFLSQTFPELAILFARMEDLLLCPETDMTTDPVFSISLQLTFS